MSRLNFAWLAAASTIAVAQPLAAETIEVAAGEGAQERLQEALILAAEGDEVVVFYAGHGVQVAGVNYLPAVDADIRSEEDVPLNSLNLNTLLDRLDEAKAGIKLVFLDACRNNPYARSFRSGTRGLARMGAAPSGTLLHFATRPGSVAADGDGTNGLYTQELARQLDAPRLPVEQMLKRVAAAVENASKGQQEPWAEGSIKGDFYFNPEGDLQLANVEVEPSSGGVDFGDLERARRERESVRTSWTAWQSRMAADFEKAMDYGDAKLSATAWQRFLEAYGEDNPFSTEDERLRVEARARLTQVQSASPQTDRRTIGAHVDDKGIEWRVASIIKERFGDRAHVNVPSFNRNVLLTGEIHDESARSSLASIAANVLSVRGVANEVEVAGISTSSSRDNDALLVSRIETRLAAARDFDARAFKVVAEAGIVFLMGLVTRDEADIATEIARTTAGARKVVRVFEYVTADEVQSLRLQAARNSRGP